MDSQSLRESIGIKAISIFLGIVFLTTGGLKIGGWEPMIESFLGWGYSVGFMYLIGILELAGAVMILAPRARFYGASLLSILMIGAAFTHIRAGQWTMLPAPIVMLILIGIVGWAERAVRGPRERHA